MSRLEVASTLIILRDFSVYICFTSSPQLPRNCILLLILSPSILNMAHSMLLSTGIRYENLPQSYVRPMSERPRLSEVVSEDVPMIDLGSHDKEKVVHQIGAACQSYGFFQVTNHGVSVESMRKMIIVGREFFHLPVEEKMIFYSEDPLKKIRLSTSCNAEKETVGNWRDYLRLHCHPLEEFVPDWPSNPSSFKDVVSAYCKEIRQLGFILMEAISESLGLEKNCIEMMMGEQGHHMAINYYPPCPEPELTYGIPGHTDPNAITILLQDEKVAGLQVLKDGKWIAINPCPNTLVVNLGDQIQALSNGRYKSVRHRAIVNSNKERISVASFLCPSNNAIVGPAKQLITEESPAMYKNFTYDDYYKKFWSRNLDDEPCLEHFTDESISG